MSRYGRCATYSTTALRFATYSITEESGVTVISLVRSRFVHLQVAEGCERQGMAKFKAYLLIGPDVAGVEELHEELTARSDDLAIADLYVPAVTAADIHLGSVEIRRIHKVEGLRRKDVEGTWVEICRAAEKCRADVVIGLDQYAAADGDQIALLLDGLRAFQTHVVVTLTGEDPSQEFELEDVIGPWSRLVKPHRFHVLDVEDGAGLDDVLSDVAVLARRERLVNLDRRREKIRKQLRRTSAA